MVGLFASLLVLSTFIKRCAVFTEKEMRILEDNEDLFYYHQVVRLLIPSCELRPLQDGYQHNVTSAMTVELLKNLLESAEGKELPQQGKFFFCSFRNIFTSAGGIGYCQRRGMDAQIIKI